MGNYFSNNLKIPNTNQLWTQKKTILKKTIPNTNQLWTQKKTILKKTIPKQTIQIKSLEDYVSAFKKYKISENLEIKFFNSFNEPIIPILISKFRLYDKIIFGFSFNQPVKNKIPGNIQFIQFGHNFNMCIDNLVIPGEDDILEELVLGDKFNQPVNNLSPNLKKISFGYEFNNYVDNLPNNIEYIKFGHNFNYQVDYLPCSLKYIIFGNNFNFTIDNLPSSIVYVELDKEFNKSINCIPVNLKKIKLNKEYYEKNKKHIENIILSNEFIEICF